MLPESAFRGYLATPAVRDWLCRCYSTSFAHGSQLVETWLVGGNVSQACKILDELVDRGWIKPFPTATPSREMVFFGVGGRRGGINTTGKKWRESHTYACEFGFEPNYDSEELMSWVRADNEAVRAARESASPCESASPRKLEPEKKKLLPWLKKR